MRTKIDWLNIFKEQGESSLSVNEYCELHNINISTFRKMKWKFLKTAKTEEIEAKIEPTTQETVTNEKIRWSIVQTKQQIIEEPLTIELGKFRIKVDEKSNLSNLKKVCEVLMSLC